MIKRVLKSRKAPRGSNIISEIYYLFRDFLLYWKLEQHQCIRFKNEYLSKLDPHKHAIIMLCLFSTKLCWCSNHFVFVALRLFHQVIEEQVEQWLLGRFGYAFTFLCELTWTCERSHNANQMWWMLSNPMVPSKDLPSGTQKTLRVPEWTPPNDTPRNTLSYASSSYQIWSSPRHPPPPPKYP